MRARVAPLWLLVVLAALLVVAGCGLVNADPVTPSDPDLAEPKPGNDAGERLAMVDEVEVLILESFPVQVIVVARGHLNDAVTYIDRVTQRLEGDTIVVRIYTTRDEDAIGAQVLVPFEESIRLDIDGLGLEPGAYTVDVNGITATLELEAGMLG